MQHNQPPPPKRNLFQRLFGCHDDPPFARAFRVAASVILIMLLGLALSGLLRLTGLMPAGLPFSWSGMGEEFIVKPGGAFVGVLFLHVLRQLIRARRRGLAFTLVAATGPLCFFIGLMTFGFAQVFNWDALTNDALVAWLVLFLVPLIFFCVVIQLEPTWLRNCEQSVSPPGS